MKKHMLYILTLVALLLFACVQIINGSIGNGATAIVFSAIALMCAITFIIGCAFGAIFIDRL